MNVAALPRTKGRRDRALPAPERRGLSRDEAADYIGISPSLFDRAVKDGLMPQPKRLYGRTTWDREALDAAYNALPGGGPAGTGNPWDE